MTERDIPQFFTRARVYALVRAGECGCDYRTIDRSERMRQGRPNGSRALRLRVAEEREHGEDAPVIVLDGRKAELGEDARNVLLDRAQGDEQALRDCLVGAPLGHQPDHLALTGRQLLERVVGAPRPRAR